MHDAGNVSDSITQSVFQVPLSKDLAKALENTLKNCGTINSRCYETFKDVLLRPSTDLDARGIQAGALTVTPAISVGILSAIFAKFAYKYKYEERIPMDFNFTQAELENASAASTESVRATSAGESAPYATITPTPHSVSAIG